MKKMIAGLLGFVLSASLVVPSYAQNKVNRYDSAVTGAPSYTLNSGGSFYGQLFNSATSSLFSLGFGSSQSTSGTAILSWNSAGHLILGGIGVPLVTSCGTAPSVVAGSDNAGDLTMGTDAPSTCTLTFAAAYTTAPHCFVNNRTSNFLTLARTTTTTLIIVGSVSGGKFGAAADIIDYMCVGH